MRSASKLRETAESVWPLLARIIAFALGAFLLYGQSKVPNPPGAQESLVLAGIGLMGPLGASVFASGVEKARKDPPE